jgi:hypothetical protein
VESRRSDIDAGIARLARWLDAGVAGASGADADGFASVETDAGAGAGADADALATADADTLTEAEMEAEADLDQGELQSLCDTLLGNPPADAPRDDRTVLLAALRPA